MEQVVTSSKKRLHVLLGNLRRQMRRLKLTICSPTETQVQASIVEAIHKTRRGRVVRYNAGAVYNDRDQFIRFNSAPGHSDLGGARYPDGRAFSLECTRPGWKGPSTEREKLQEQFLNDMRAMGAIAAFVTSVDEALAALAG
jgi:hypothetical protein